MNPNDVAPMLISIVLFFSVGAAIILRGPLGKAFARRIEGKAGTDPAMAQRIEELEHRLAELAQDRVRVGELEERLDFAERLLAAPAEPLKDGAR